MGNPSGGEIGGGDGGGAGTSGTHAATPSDGTLIGVQIASGVCAGASSGFLTTPLDIVKTRLQVLSGQPGRRRAHVLEHGEGTLSGTRRRGVPSRRAAEDDLGVHMGDDHGHHLRVFEAVSVGGTRRRDVG